MIVYDLSCDRGHRFEGWFGSSADYGEQHARGLVRCPQCDSADVNKAPMAPAVPAKGNSAVANEARQPPAQQLANAAMPAEVRKAFAMLAQAQAKALENSQWVGDSFADKARAMHYGETDMAPIHGQASKDEAEELVAEGVAVAPILFPIAAPDELN